MKAILPLLLVLAMSGIGMAQNIEVAYEENHTIELYEEKNVSVMFTNYDTLVFDVDFDVPDPWLSINETSFVLNTTNSTKRHNMTVSIRPAIDIGTFTRTVPYTLSWNGGLSEEVLEFRIATIEPQTTLQIDAIKDDFEIEMLESDKAVIDVKNNGTMPAWNVTFSCSKWCAFDDADQNNTLQEGQSDLVVFNINVPVIPSDETNVTHGIEVCIMAANTRKNCDSIHVFVPFANQSITECYLPEITPTKMAEVMGEFCSQFPFSPYCYFPGDQNATIIRLPCNLENLTQEDMNAYSVCRRDLEDIQLKFDNCQANLTKVLLENKQITEKTLRTAEGAWGQSTGFTILVILFILIILGYGGYQVFLRVRG